MTLPTLRNAMHERPINRPHLSIKIGKKSGNYYSSCRISFRRRSYLFGIRKKRNNYSGIEYCHLDSRFIIYPISLGLAYWRHILDLANSRCVQTLQKTERGTAASGKMKPCF